MARKLRVEYPGAIDPVMNRGDRRESIFRDDEDRKRFLTPLGEACAKTGWQVEALGLMSNHFHLVLRKSQARVSEPLAASQPRLKLMRIYFPELLGGCVPGCLDKTISRSKAVRMRILPAGTPEVLTVGDRINSPVQG
jgi:hypothetical protein